MRKEIEYPQGTEQSLTPAISSDAARCETGLRALTEVCARARPKSGGAIGRLADANDAFVAAAIRARSNLAILIYCIPANVQPSHCGLLCIDEVRKKREVTVTPDVFIQQGLYRARSSI